MKIGIYAPFFHPFTGGAERVAQQVAQALALRQHEVIVYTFQYDPKLAQEITDGKVLIRRFPYTVTRPLGFTRVHSEPLLEAIKNDKIDLLQMHGVIFPDFALRVFKIAKRRCGLPRLLVPHGFYEAYQGDDNLSLWRRIIYVATVRPLLAQLVWLSSHVALFSPQDKELLRKFRFPENRSSFVYNGFEPVSPAGTSGTRFRERFASHGERLILHVASIKPNKGHDVVLQAMRRIVEQHGSVKYVAIGGTSSLWQSYADDLQRQAAYTEVSDHVVFLGHVSDEDLADAYDAADVVILPSYSETFPLSVLDAMAREKPIVATNVGGVSHMIVDGKSGLVVPPGDSARLAEAIGYFLSNKDTSRRFGKAARADAYKRFTWSSVIDRYENISIKLVRE